MNKKKKKQINKKVQLKEETKLAFYGHNVGPKFARFGFENKNTPGIDLSYVILIKNRCV